MTALEYQPLVLIETADLPEEEWLEYRRKGIGGSDAAAVLGVSPFATARDIYYDKLHQIPYEDQEDNWVAKKIGHLLEDLVAEIFRVKTGYRIYQIKKMFYHPVHTFMLADVDYFVTLPDGTTAILEIKTTNYNAKEHWYYNGQPIVPVNYEIQGRHYMCVMNVDHVFYCCLYGNNEQECLIRHIERDMDYESELIALEKDFWHNHVLARIPPPYTEDGNLIIASVRRQYGLANEDAPAVLLGADMSVCMQRYLELQARKAAMKAEIDKVEREMKRLRGFVIAEMGRSCTASCSIGAEPYTITYKPIHKTTIEKNKLLQLKERHPDIYAEYVTTSESRRFDVKKSKQEAA